MSSIRGSLILFGILAFWASDASIIPRFRRSPQQQTGILTKPSVVDTPTGGAAIPQGSVVVPPGQGAPETPGIETKPSVVDTPNGLQSIPAGSKVVPPQQQNGRNKRQAQFPVTETKPSVVDTPTGGVAVPQGSKVVPPEVAPQVPGIETRPSVVDTPAGLQSIPAGSKVVPPQQQTGPKKRAAENERDEKEEKDVPAIETKPSIVDTPKGGVAIPEGSKVVLPDEAEKVDGIETRPSAVQTAGGLISVPAGSKVMPPEGSGLKVRPDLVSEATSTTESTTTTESTASTKIDRKLSVKVGEEPEKTIAEHTSVSKNE